MFSNAWKPVNLARIIILCNLIAIPPITMIQVVAHARKFRIRNTFQNVMELQSYAGKFLRDRPGSLDKDVKRCLKEPFAPFLAILYCFSTIDLLGALYAGEAEKKIKVKKKPSGGSKKLKFRPPKTVQNSRKYMKRFMYNNGENIRLLRQLWIRIELWHFYIAIEIFNNRNSSRWYRWFMERGP